VTTIRVEDGFYCYSSSWSLAWIIHQSRIKIAERVILQQLRQFCHPNTLFYQIIAGYEDSNDSNKLRQDPIFKLVCNQVPTVGENGVPPARDDV
jgi:hypothetical protein